MRRTFFLSFLVLLLLHQPVFAQARVDIPAAYQWDLTEIFHTKADWADACTQLETEWIPQYTWYKGRLSDRASVRACLETDTEIKKRLDQVYAYAVLTLAQDNADTGAQEMLGEVTRICESASDAASYIGPELLRLEPAVLERYRNDPALQNRARFFESLLQEKPHVLTEKEESLLSRLFSVAEAPSDIFSKLTNVDMTFADVNGSAFTAGTYEVLRESPDREVRKAAFQSLYSAYMCHNNTLAATLAAAVNLNVFSARARNYGSALEAALSPDIPTEVYDNLIARANDGLEALHRYMRLRKEVLGVDRLRMYDLYAPLVPGGFAIAYDDTRELLSHALSPLGAEYVGVLHTAMDEHWIDVYETPGKTNGAYCLGLYAPHPFVLLNYKENAVSTLAHELGHAINDSFAFAAHPYEYAGTPVFTAEVASTVNEILLARYQIDHAETTDEKLYRLCGLVELYRGAFYTQAMYAEFEKAIYERAEAGGVLTADALNTLWSGLLSKYYGDAFETNELAACAWSRIPHFYRGFYVYQYATSIAAAHRLSQEILSGEPDRYLAFLSAGSSRDPLTVLAEAGADMRSPEPVDELIEAFDALITEMEALNALRCSP